jgi:hypothetical protein
VLLPLAVSMQAAAQPREVVERIRRAVVAAWPPSDPADTGPLPDTAVAVTATTAVRAAPTCSQPGLCRRVSTSSASRRPNPSPSRRRPCTRTHIEQADDSFLHKVEQRRCDLAVELVAVETDHHDVDRTDFGCLCCHIVASTRRTTCPFGAPMPGDLPPSRPGWASPGTGDSGQPPRHGDTHAVECPVQADRW